MRNARFALAAVVVAASSCAAERPAHFADVPAVEDMRDDGPVPMVRRRDPVIGAELSEAYVERPMIEALDPTRASEAGDVNARDEVPRSTWFAPGEADLVADADDAPAPPYRVLTAEAVTREHAIAILDSRGRRFEAWRDPPDRPEMATGAAAVASRLLRTIGYFTPGVWALAIPESDFLVTDDKQRTAIKAFEKSGPPPEAGRFRTALTRWPIGLDVGPTPSSGLRADDGNDRVPHEDRRTLRAMKLVFGWLGMTGTDTTVLRDAYLGAPAKGHLTHYIAGLGGALGADAVVRPVAAKDDDSDLAGLNVWITLGSLGLYKQRPRATSKRWPALGEYQSAWSPLAFHTSPPFAPMDRMLPSDAYWAAKQIAAIETPALVRALDAGDYHDASARSTLLDILRVRQAIAIRWGVTQVSACEVDRLEQPAEGGGDRGAVLVMRDDAPSLGIVDTGTTIYRVDLVDTAGKRIVPRADIHLTEGSIFPVRLPATAPSYVVARVWAIRPEGGSKRPMEAHLVHGARWKLVGVIH